MTETEYSAATLAHLRAALRGNTRWVFVTDLPDAERFLKRLAAFQAVEGYAAGVECGRVEWIATSGAARGALWFLTVPTADLPREVVEAAFDAVGQTPPDPGRTVYVLSVGAKGRDLARFVRGIRGGRLFAAAGVWDVWQDGAATVFSCCMITTAPNDAIAAIPHHRMPAVLAPGDYAAWLDPAAAEKDLRALLRAYPADGMHVAPAARPKRVAS